jgi:hypothetical protein
MKNSIVNSKLTAFAAAVLMCCSVLFIQSNALAQCPDASGPAPDPATCPWTSESVTQTIPGTTCSVTVDYCWRDCTGYGIQVYVTEVEPAPSVACGAIDPLTLIYDAKSIAIQDALSHDPNQPPPCIGGITSLVTTFVPACWLAQQTISGNNIFIPCSPYACVCQQQCQACFNVTGYTISGCTTVGAPECDCYSLDLTFPPAGQFQYNVCYRVPCQ